VAIRRAENMAALAEDCGGLFPFGKWRRRRSVRRFFTSNNDEENL